MLKVDKKWLEVVEKNYNGITKMVEKYENMDLPKCPYCNSSDTAVTNVGIVGRSINLASATTKFHLRPNGKPGEYYCNNCKKYF